jgi:hypothetical protein
MTKRDHEDDSIAAMYTTNYTQTRPSEAVDGRLQIEPELLQPRLDRLLDQAVWTAKKDDAVLARIGEMLSHHVEGDATFGVVRRPVERRGSLRKTKRDGRSAHGQDNASRRAEERATY